ncbi:TetR/AcrR family transcriptional regulator [Mycobacterium spongiae]|uniref:TetR family transcriptional regulator n=1 Tax=Mycobacterium spongiae TaxID=886343 RepID=A0A975JY17_9MYCO|nr:TetR/AcrR family transcriptional regulator [Mycobacterium spongiae]QUR67794.1 TetR family transcriptional regulator [Mycobacterium spongiae]
MDSERAAVRPLRRDAAHNRQRIVDAARDLFAMRGLEASHNEVAHHAGVGVGTVYRRFPTKESLVDATFEDGIDEITALGHCALNKPDSWLGLAYFVEEMCQLTARDQGLREAVFSREYGGDRVEAARVRLYPMVAEVVERARADGYLRADINDSDLALMSIIAGAVNEFAGDIRPDLWRRYVTIFLDGMRADGDQALLPVEALSADQHDAAMRSWNPRAHS